MNENTVKSGVNCLLYKRLSLNGCWNQNDCDNIPLISKIMAGTTAINQYSSKLFTILIGNRPHILDENNPSRRAF